MLNSIISFKHKTYRISYVYKIDNFFRLNQLDKDPDLAIYEMMLSEGK